MAQSSSIGQRTPQPKAVRTKPTVRCAIQACSIPFPHAEGGRFGFPAGRLETPRRRSRDRSAPKQPARLLLFLCGPLFHQALGRFLPEVFPRVFCLAHCRSPGAYPLKPRCVSASDPPLTAAQIHFSRRTDLSATGCGSGPVKASRCTGPQQPGLRTISLLFPSPPYVERPLWEPLGAGMAFRPT